MIANQVQFEYEMKPELSVAIMQPYFLPYLGYFQLIDIVEIDSLETPDRELFPIKYNVLSRCDKTKDVRDSEIKFRWI